MLIGCASKLALWKTWRKWHLLRNFFPWKGYLKRMFCTTDLINFYWIILIFLSSLAECGFYFLLSNTAYCIVSHSLPAYFPQILHISWGTSFVSRSTPGWHFKKNFLSPLLWKVWRSVWDHKHTIKLLWWVLGMGHHIIDTLLFFRGSLCVSRMASNSRSSCLNPLEHY